MRLCLIIFILINVVLPLNYGKTQANSERIESVAWSPDGNYIAAAFQDTIHIYDTQLNELFFLDVDYVTGLYWSPDSTRLAFVHSIFEESSQLPIGLVEIRDMTSKSYVIPPLKINEGGPLSWNPDGTQLAVGDVAVETQTGLRISYLVVPIIDTTTGQIVRNIKTGEITGISDLSWSPDGQYIAVTDSAILNLWNLSADIVDVVSEVQPVGTGALAWSPDSLQVAFSSRVGIIIWDIEKRRVVRTLGSEGAVFDIDWQADNIAVTDLISEDQLFVRVWQASTGILLTEKQEISLIYSVALSPDGSQLVYGGADALLKLIDIPSE